MHQRHRKNANDALKENPIVLLTNAVVNPAAVVIKFIDAAVARPAVFSGFEHVSVAYFTQVLVACPIEAFAFRFSHPLEAYSGIRWVNTCGFIP